MVRYRKSGKNRKLTLSKVNKKVNSLMVAEEKKFMDVLHSGGVSTTTSVHPLLDGLALGTTSQTRIGSVITGKSLSGRFEITAGDFTNQLRIFLLKSYVINDAAPTIGDILQYDDVNTFWELMTSPYKKNSNIKYSVLKNWRINIGGRITNNGDAAATSASQKKYITFNVNLRQTQLRYETDDTASQNQYNYFLMAVSDSGAANHPTLNGISRLTYTDS
jgi:hypothetical protein